MSGVREISSRDRTDFVGIGGGKDFVELSSE